MYVENLVNSGETLTDDAEGNPDLSIHSDERATTIENTEQSSGSE